MTEHRSAAIESLCRALSLAVAEARQPSREVEAERDEAVEEFVDEIVLVAEEQLKGPKR